MGALIARGWWRRNAIPLIALVVSATATVVVGVVVPLNGDAEQQRAPRRVAAAHDVRLGGAVFRLTKAGLFHRDGKAPAVDVPEGSMLLAVLIRIRSPRALSSTCSVRLVRDGSDKIWWDPVLSPVDYRYGLSATTLHSCALDAAGTRTLEEVFLVPEDVYRHVTVRLSVTSRDVTGGASLELPSRPYSDRTA